MEQKILNNKCKCPYCFRPFFTETVLFKAQTVYTQQDLFEFTVAEKESKKQYQEGEDRKYKEFWNQYPGTKVSFKYEKNPTMLATAVDAGEDFAYPVAVDKKRDKDGFLFQATDGEGRDTNIRICPHCHNPLPHEYGKYPVKYIAVVGITSSGKTVYLAQLLTKIREILGRADLTTLGQMAEVDDFVEKYRIVKDRPLPRGNTTDVLTLPIPVNVVNKKDNKKYTLVFYDIAGENCVDTEQMKKYGLFIENANGIVLIVDPMQFAELFHLTISDMDKEENAPRPEKVVEAMYNAFAAANGTGGRSSIPLAAAISKSDMLRNYLPENLNLFHQINYEVYESFGFPAEECRNVHTEIEMQLKRKGSCMQGILFCDQLAQCFPIHKFFAFSALNVEAVKKKDENGVIYSTVEEDPETLRIEEPIFWVLNQMGVVPEAIKKGTVHKTDGSLLHRLFGR